ncbi:Stage II sporulation protein E [Neomoorella glycerini]|uniref:Stage II sporulation protein E n=1 Tax=Neomoorella glycerini TaxID=55779 RepID=A0A6I5ZQ72_9FIRM|nr:SpoIIE family protein phosphatase [Moorella glycerini]QGP92093.1 Stage II sporulation protein E [Moorella glycerini]
MSGQPGVHLYRREVELTVATRLVLDFLFLVAAFCLARGALLEELFPFGPAAVITAAVRRSRLLWPVALISVAGSWFSSPAPAYSRLLLFLLLGLIFTLYPALRRGSILTQATLAPVTIILVRGLSLTLWQPSFYGWVQVIFEALLAWGLSLAFLAATMTTRQEERLLGGGLFLAGVLLGLQGWQLFGLSLQGLISSYILLLVSLAGGPGTGAAAGAAVGFLPSLSHLVTPALAGLLAFAGLIAGSLKSLGKPGVISGFLLAHLLLASYFLGQDSALAALKEGGLVALALAATPSFLINYLQRFLAAPVTMPAVQEGHGRQERLKTALKSLARSLKFTGFKESPMVTVRQVARATCRGCPAGKVCWELEGEQMVTLLQELLQKGSQGSLTTADIPEWLSSRCSRCRELLAALTGEAIKMQVRPPEDGLNNWLAATFETLAAMLVNGGPNTGTGAGEGEELPLWQVTVGMAAAPRYQAEVSGDTCLAGPLEPGRQLLVLGDGMGAGREAAETSATAIELVRDLLAAGFTPEMALRTINMILLLRSPKESFTTCDLALINCGTGTAEFYKLGACPTFIQRDGQVKTLSSHSLPAGILEDLQVEPLREELQDGDLLVMVSDGILEAHRDINEKERWLAKALQRVGDARPQEIADRLLKQARALVDGKPRDDMTVMVARMERSGV